jgi:uncharacterized SAM-binding protein YcdF (DUF218 family)
MELTPFFFGLYKFVKYGAYPVTWLTVCSGTVLILTWLPDSPRRRRWLRLIATASFFLLLFLTSPVVSGTLIAVLESRYEPLTLSTAKAADVIVVLGGGIRDRGTLRPAVDLTDEAIHRTLCGADLYLHGMAPTLLMAGGDAAIVSSGPTESQAMKELAVRLGVPAEAVLVEDRSRTTYENARESRRLLGDRTSILLVTSAYHIPRATALFHKQGFQVTPYPCGFHARNRPMEEEDRLNLFDFLPNLWALNRMHEVVEETAGLLAYTLAGKA